MNEYQETESIEAAKQVLKDQELRRQGVQLACLEHDFQYEIAKNNNTLAHLNDEDTMNATRCFAETVGSHLLFWTFINKLRLDGLTITKS